MILVCIMLSDSFWTSDLWQQKQHLSTHHPIVAGSTVRHDTRLSPCFALILFDFCMIFHGGNIVGANRREMRCAAVQEKVDPVTPKTPFIVASREKNTKVWVVRSNSNTAAELLLSIWGHVQLIIPSRPVVDRPMKYEYPDGQVHVLVCSTFAETLKKKVTPLLSHETGGFPLPP